jgi:flagellar basal body P-ring formation protein FlgA
MTRPTRPTRLCRLLAVLVALSPAPGLAAAWLEAGQPLDPALAERLVADALHEAADAGSRALEVQITRPPLPLANPSSSPSRVRVESVERDARSGRFTALLAVDNGDRLLGRVVLEGRAEALVEVPVLTVPVAPGTVIAADAVEHTLIAASRLTPDSLVETAAVVGSEAARRLPAGRALRARDVVEPRLVRRGRPVVMVYARAGLRVTALGRALDDGAMGATVRIANVDSNRRLEAVVVGPDEVVVGP